MTPLDLKKLTLGSGLRLEVAERGRGPAILFLHGYTDSWRSFEPVLHRLPEDVRALAPSQRGHGDSERPLFGYRIEDLAADAVSILDAAGIDDAMVVGHSMGSLVAQELAISHPHRVARLVLVGSATTFDVQAVRELSQAVDQLEDPIPYDFAEGFQKSTIHRPVSDAFLRTAVGESRKVPARVWRDALAGVIGFHADGRLSRLTMPTLIVWGDHDQIGSRSEQDRLKEQIRGSTLLCYEDIGHAIHWEQPERFTRDILAFLRAGLTSGRAQGGA